MAYYRHIPQSCGFQRPMRLCTQLWLALSWPGLGGNVRFRSSLHSPRNFGRLMEATRRGNAMALFAVAIWAGPSLGPIVGAFLDEAKGWR